MHLSHAFICYLGLVLLYENGYGNIFLAVIPSCDLLKVHKQETTEKRQQSVSAVVNCLISRLIIKCRNQDVKSTQVQTLISTC